MGFAYFVEDVKYQKYLLTVTDQKEISTYTGFAALDHANNNCGSGYATSVLRFNLVGVEIRELRPEVVAESNEVLVHYQSRTNV